MAWSHLDVTKPHLVYIILGGFTSLFMLCSSFIKERMYIGEATVATLCGVIFGPHAANLINPNEWGSVDIVTLEFSRIVLVVQCFAIGVELPKFYMERHWRSVVFLLVPVMVAGWLLVSLFIWWMITPLNWLESLVISACVTATDPVLASSVVGKGKFAKRVPKHLRDLLSAESGCNDGMAFPFIYLSLYLIQYHQSAREVTFHFVVYVILYECIFGAVYGFILGYIARHGIKYAEKHDLVDRESFLVFYFVVALFCAGSGSILGLDDLLVGFSCGVGFSNDGWFGEKTEESHVSNVIDLLLNLAYFVYFGTIIPWEQYNNNVFGMQAWRLVVIAVFVLLFRRIPIMMALKPFIPDVKNWREALFAGHFGPIGVGAIFVAILARAELEHHEPVPLAELPPESVENYKLIYLVWPIVTFLVISSILIHGSSIAVFTLGKRINTLTLTMSYTAAPDEGPSWMNRLPRISSQSRSQARVSEASFDERKEPEFPPGTLAPPMGFLRRQKDDNGHNRSGSRASSLVSRKRKNKKWDDGIGPGGPVTQTAIFPNRPAPVGTNSEKEPSPLAHENTDSTTLSDDSPKDKDPEKAEAEAAAKAEEAGEGGTQPQQRPPAPPPRVEVYDEGDHIVFENEDGEVLDVQRTPDRVDDELPRPNLAPVASSSSDPFSWSLGGLKRKMTEVYSSEVEKRKEKGKSHRRHEPARAYQFGNTIIVEDGDGEVVKTYQLPSQRDEAQDGSDFIGSGLKYLGLGARVRHPGRSRPGGRNAEAAAEEGEAGAPSSSTPATKPSGWSGFGRGAGAGQTRRRSVGQEDDDDDKNIRFTIGGVGQRMTKDDFIREVQQLDVRTRKEVVDHSSASSAVKRLAQEGPPSARMAGGQPLGGPVERGSNNSMREGIRVGRGRAGSVSPGRQPSASSSESSKAHPTRSPELDQTETPVERKRRLAVLANQGDEDDDGDVDDEYGGETPAERRRRHAALGMAGDSDSEDEGTERVPPARRGIRFAEPQRGGKKE